MIPRVVILSVRGLRVHATVGVTPAEQEVGIWLEADIDAETECTADHTDQLADTVDYGALADLFVTITENHPRTRTLERLALLYSEAVLARFASVQALDVTIRKPNPAIGHPVGSVGVSYRYERA